MFEKEKDIFHYLINKELQHTLSFYYDKRKNILFFKNSYRFIVVSIRCVVDNLKSRLLSKRIDDEFDGPIKSLWFFVDTKNNYHSLKDIHAHFSPFSLYVTYNTAKFLEEKVVLKQRFLSVSALRFLLFSLYIYFNNRYSARSLETIYSKFHLYEFYKRLLQKAVPKAIFFSNDHTPSARALLIAANDLGIKTIYLQHASVTKYFPPLKFSLSLLDGLHSLDIYKKIEPVQGTVILSGLSRFGVKEKDIVSNEKFKIIGVAFNMRDKIVKVKQFIETLIESTEISQIIVRKHPRDKRVFHFDHIKVSFSDPSLENSLTYLKTLDMLVANNSTILLEAALVNVAPIQFNFSEGNQTDNYGFLKNGLAQEVQTIEELKLIIQKGRVRGRFYRTKAKYYDASVDTNFEFDNQRQVLQCIEEHLSVKKSDRSKKNGAI